jgi:hypothetical protein
MNFVWQERAGMPIKKLFQTQRRKGNKERETKEDEGEVKKRMEGNRRWKT